MGRPALVAVVLISLMMRAAAAHALSGPSVTLPGNHPAEAASFHPLAHPNPSAQLNMQVTLGLRNRGELDQLLRDQQDPASPRYHQWLTPAQFAARFDPSQQDVDAVAQWLNAQGFRVIAASPALRSVRFRGAIADAERAFGTSIMTFGDGSAYSNITDPAIPARFSGVITAVGGLDNFLHSTAFSHLLPIRRQSGAAASGLSSGPLAFDSGPALPMAQRGAISPVPDINVGGLIAFGPSDVDSFYDKPATLNGAGNCVAVIGDSNYTPGAVSLFNSTFSLPASNIKTLLVNGSDPGINGDELEALVDLEWTHAIAPGAATRFYLGDNAAQTPNGPVIDGIQAAVNDPASCGSIGVSFGLCGGSAKFYMTMVSPTYAQAATQGQSIFIATGDEGAAGVVLDPTGTTCVIGTSRNINELGGDEHVTDVGGTFFIPNINSAGNNVGNVPESAWNAFYSNPNPPPATTQLATGGGASAFFPKPTNPPYQTGPGVPADGRRDVPDVAMVAAIDGPDGPGVFVGDVDPNTGLPSIDCCVIGTSLAAQIWSGIAKLIAQLKGKPLGPLNPRIYALANAGLAQSGFRDVTSGNNDFGGVIGFKAKAGYDQATGWGTVDIGRFAHAYVAPPPPTIISVTSPVRVGSSFTITGTSFSAGAKVNFFVATAGGPLNAGPLSPSAVTPTRLTVPVPATVPLGQGFVSVQVVNADLVPPAASNSAPALLQGFAPAGIPSLTSINGVPLAPTSGEASFATNNVQTVIIQGTSVKLGGSGFDTAKGVAVNVFCACPPTGNAGPVFVNPGSGGLTSSSFSFTLPAKVPTGPASLAVINQSNFKSSNAVSVPVGATITVKSVTQLGTTITVNGTGFSTLTVINLFNRQGTTTPNLGGLTAGGVAKIHLNLINSTRFTFTKPATAVPGPSYVQALNPPYVPFTSSGTGPGGAFTLK